MLTLVISETIRGSKINGILIALAPLITDLPIVLVTIFFLKSIPETTLIPAVLSFAGAFFLIYIGIKNLRFNSLTTAVTSGYSSTIKYGILTNFLSPHPYLFWITVGAPTFIKASKITISSGIAFVVAFYCLLIGSKIVIALLTGVFKNLLTGKIYQHLIKTLGVILFLLSGVMIYDGIMMIL